MAQPVGVYYFNQSSESDPSYFIELAEARKMKRHNRAFFINHGKSIRLLESSVFARPIPEERQKMGWRPIPSGTLAIGFVDVLQLV